MPGTATALRGCHALARSGTRHSDRRSRGRLSYEPRVARVVSLLNACAANAYVCQGVPNTRTANSIPQMADFCTMCQAGRPKNKHVATDVRTKPRAIVTSNGVCLEHCGF